MAPLADDIIQIPQSTLKALLESAAKSGWLGAQINKPLADIQVAVVTAVEEGMGAKFHA